MKAYKIIGIMTGNSMDAIDMVLTEFDGKNIVVILPDTGERYLSML